MNSSFAGSLIVCFFLFLTFPAKLKAQPSAAPEHDQTHSIGVVIGYADQQLGPFDLGLNYHHQITQLKIEYIRRVFRWETTGLDMVSIPTYNFGTYGPEPGAPEREKMYEFGIHSGIRFRKEFFREQLQLFVTLAAGPHYVSGVPERQSPGFIFSDNLYLGLQYRLLPSFFLDLRTGVRHISNIGFKQPNGGVNSLLVNGGFCYRF